ncbi:MAG: hypothetical protein ABI604_18625 [Nitrospirota bacterium]
MAKPQLKRTDDPPDMPSSGGYAPKKYSAREQAAMGAKITLVAGSLFGLLWLLNAITVK